MEAMGSGGAQGAHAQREDRRRRKTRKAIFDAFESLMATQHYSKITVAHIIERADVGRSTFYAHFETKDELLEAMCTEMFDHIFAGVNAHCVTHATLRTTDLQGLLAHLLYHLRDTHSGVCGRLLRDGEPHFTAAFRARLTDLFERNMPPAPGQVPHDLLTGMVVSSFCQAVSWWFAPATAPGYPERAGRPEGAGHPEGKGLTRDVSPERLSSWFMGAQGWEARPEPQA